MDVGELTVIASGAALAVVCAGRIVSWVALGHDDTLLTQAFVTLLGVFVAGLAALRLGDKSSGGKR